MREAGEKTKTISRHRLCLIVPLAIQLSFPVIFIESLIVGEIRHEVLFVGGGYGVFYLLVVAISALWLPFYVLSHRNELGSETRFWQLVAIGSIIFFIGLVCPSL